MTLLGFTAVGLVLFRPVLATFFLSDDFAIVGKVGEDGILWILGGQKRFLRPVVVLFHALDYAVWGHDPFGFHLTNLLFHVAGAFLVFILTRRLATAVFGVQRAGFSVFAGVLFLVLPSHSEAVVWIAGRTDVIATTFGLAATLGLAALAERLTAWRAVLFATLFAAALLSKESAIAWPLIWVVMWAALRLLRREQPWHWREVAPFALVALVTATYLALRLVLIGSLVGSYGEAAARSFGRLPEMLGVAAVRSLLPPFRTKGWLESTTPLIWLAVLVVVGGIALAASRAGRERRSVVVVLVALVGSFVAAVIPVMGFAVSLSTTESERYLYLPSVFVCAGATLFLMAVVRRQAVRVALAIGLVMAEAAATGVVCSRWITAARLAREFVALVTAYDPAEVGIVNVPDSYRGVYVLRCGLNEAYVFAGRPRPRYDAAIFAHRLNSWSGELGVEVESSRLALKLPDGWRTVRLGRRREFAATTGGGRVYFSELPAWYPRQALVVDYGRDGTALTGRLVDLSQVARRGSSKVPEASAEPGEDDELDELDPLASETEE